MLQLFNILILMLFLPVTAIGQQKFSYDLLAKNKLKLQSLPIVDSIYNLDFIAENKTDTFRICTYNGNVLKHIYGTSMRGGTGSNTNFIHYKDTLLDLNMLMKEQIRNKAYSLQGLLFTQEVYIADTREGQVLILGAVDKIYTRCPVNQYWMVLKLDQDKITGLNIFSDVSFQDPSCFGDFNNDGALDYYQLQYANKRLKFFTLKKGVWSADQDYDILLSGVNKDFITDPRGEVYTKIYNTIIEKHNTRLFKIGYLKFL